MEKEDTDNYIYDFNGISLDLESLRLPMEIETHFCHGDDDDDDDDDEDWNPPSPPPYNVKDRLIELNRELLQDPIWTEKKATRLKWRSDLEEIKWFNKSTDTYSEGYISSSEDEDGYIRDYDPYLTEEYRVSPTLLASIPSDSSSESSSIVEIQKKGLNHAHTSFSFTHHQELDNEKRPECSNSREDDIFTNPPKESTEDIIAPVSASPILIHEESNVSLSDIQIDLPNNCQDFFDNVHSENKKEEESLPPKNISNMNLKHSKKRFSINSLSLSDSIDKSSISHKKKNDNANAFAQWKLKKKHEKLLSERLSYLKLRKKMTSCQRR